MAGSSDEVRVLLLYSGGTIGMIKDSSRGYIPHRGFLTSNLRAQSRFHDPEQDSVFANSSSVGDYDDWKFKASSKSTSGNSTPAFPVGGDSSHDITVRTTKGNQILPSLITPKTSHGKRIR